MTGLLKTWAPRAAAGMALAATLAMAACGGGATTTGTTGATLSCPNTKSLNGAGSTFAALIYEQAYASFAQTKCGIQVNYQPVGSGAGISQFLAQTVDFGATDSPLTDANITSSPNGTILEIPTTLGGVAVSYNLSQLATGTQLQLKGTTIADIFLGKVKFWDDAEVAGDNPGVTLPHEAITVVHRSDGSGTTGIFTHYLAAVSPDWANGPGAATTINWPTGVGASGNDGVAQQVKTTKGAIGYNELGYVLQNKIAYAKVQNKDGSAFVAPSAATVSAAAAAVDPSTIPADLRFFIVNEPGANSYPISGFSWSIVYQKQTDADKGTALAQALWYMIHTGQQFAVPSYAALPSLIVGKGEAQIKSMQCGSSACFQGVIQ